MLNIVIVGATGAVGQELIMLLEDRQIPFDNLKLIASRQSVGKEIYVNSNNYDAFNNPSYNVEYYNSPEWRGSQIPSMGGHGNSDSVASIYDLLANDYKQDSHNIIRQDLLKKYLSETNSRKDLSLNFQIRWSQLGFVLRGGWMFGKYKESFGHNGWGGSLGFADPINGLGISYVTKELNPTMGVDNRAIILIKKFYDLLI